MRFRCYVALLAVPAAIVLAASCVPPNLTGAEFSAPGLPGSGGASLGNSGTSAVVGAGGASIAFSGGTGAQSGNPPASLQYLCGGAGAVCVPGPQDDCAQGGNPGMGGAPPDASAVSCKVVVADGGVAAHCGVSGNMPEGSPCMNAADCGPDLGCILVEHTPLCRAYCCAGLESCPTNTYCVQQKMYESPSSEIPVCIHVTKCVLLDDTGCPSGETCAIVRLDGTTSCVVPGTGTYGQPCPCAAGYTCSYADGTCLKLCHTDLSKGDECGPNGYCQGGTTPYPPEVGYCIYY
jgi:hypothetical protein